MRNCTIGLAVVVAITMIYFAQVAAADKPTDLIVGKWEQKKDGKIVRTFEFQKDGKVKYFFNDTEYTGTYKILQDDTVEMMLLVMGKNTLVKALVNVTKDKLVMTDTMRMNEDTFTRLK